MTKGKAPVHPALKNLSPAKWKEILEDIEEMAEEMRSEGLDVKVVHPLGFRYTEYNEHSGPCFKLSAQRWEEISPRVKEGKINRYEVLITPKGWMRILVVILHSDEEKLAFMLPLQIENRHIHYMKQLASEKMEMWLHMDNVQKEYVTIPLYGALASLGHEDDSVKEPVPVKYKMPDKKTDKKKLKADN